MMRFRYKSIMSYKRATFEVYKGRQFFVDYVILSVENNINMKRRIESDSSHALEFLM